MIFTLFAIIQKYLLKNNKLHVASITAFRKAFDVIPNSKLWPILHKTGIKGKMLRTIQSVHSVAKARVRCGSKLTDTFPCMQGLKQGE